MTIRAVVLGGGGMVGVAWEVGVIQGLAVSGVEVAGADILLGTSAGALVSGALCLGHSLDTIARRPEISGGANPIGDEMPATRIANPQDAAKGLEIFALWTRRAGSDPEARRRITELALQVESIPQSALLATIGGLIPDSPWPERLRVTAVDGESGEFVVFTKNNPAPLTEAVAASCAVPAIFHPITIDGRPYIDGGVHSTTSADTLIEDRPDQVLIIAPLAGEKVPGLGPVAIRALEQEREKLEDSGAQVYTIAPNAEDRAAFGADMMNVAAQPPSLEAGRIRGMNEASCLLERLGSFHAGS